jgi:probable rRNA maturation factor
MASKPPAPVSVAVQWAIEADHPPFSEIDNAQIRRWAKACFVDRAEITIRMVGKEEGQKLNREFRGKDYPTNVLTFPLSDKPLHPSGQASAVVFMADIIICPGVVEEEAVAQNKTVFDHLAHLIIHGCLHAQGYTHDNDPQAQLMEAKEIEILKRFKIANPYYSSTL